MRMPPPVKSDRASSHSAGAPASLTTAASHTGRPLRAPPVTTFHMSGDEYTPARMPDRASVSAAAFTVSVFRSVNGVHRLSVSTSSHHIGASTPLARAHASASPMVLAAWLHAWQARSRMAQLPAGPCISAGPPGTAPARLTYTAAAEP